MIAVSAELQYEVAERTSFVFSVHPARSEHQRVMSEQVYIWSEREPRHQQREAVDADGNRLLVVSSDPGPLTVGYTAVVALEPFVPVVEPHGESEFDGLPADVYQYLRPSRYCESDQLTRLATRLFGEEHRGVARVQDICDWVHGHLEYVPGSTDSSSTALDVLHGAAGVCRDYSHLAIALCRAVGVPARYVSGYAVDLDPPDFHGFFEAFLRGRWYLFDATRMASIDQLVRIATGRDAADTAFATFVGSAALTGLDVAAVLTRADVAGSPVPPVSTVSTA